MKVGPKSSLRLFLHRALQLLVVVSGANILQYFHIELNLLLRWMKENAY